MIHPLWGESEFRGGHDVCHRELSKRAKSFFASIFIRTIFLTRMGLYLRKMSVWKPSAYIYITYQEQKYDKKIKFSQKFPEIALWLGNRALLFI